jgi:hypothetical protein
VSIVADPYAVGNVAPPVDEAAAWKLDITVPLVIVQAELPVV